MDDVIEHLDKAFPVLHLEFFITFGVHLISAILILSAGWFIGKRIEYRIRSMTRLDETLRTFLGGLARYSILAFAFITVLAEFGVQTASLLAILGAAGLAIGLALQGTLSNVAAGTMLLILRPFRVGDYIVTERASGTVKTLGLFGTELSTADNIYVFVPNGKIWNADITNYSRNRERRQDIKIGIDYNQDLDKALSVLRAVLEAEPRILKREGRMPEVMVDMLGDYAVNLIVRFWSLNADHWPLRWDMTKKIKEACDESGISIPFPTQTSLQYTMDKEGDTSPSQKKD